MADFLHQEAFTRSINMERTQIHQFFRDLQASAWSGWAQHEKVPAVSEADFPALGSHALLR
ncbi:hypothetical protein HPB50_009192 [Hyalomma asiaticum]|uniref:Uncharacterized protein n=1 Tax=Hyalomma asiaticum TaxID=266040 RepID=A0ACB7SJB9_HYAAI|nr:hypothetical protein HPB50_009192 [Hyalomma asiaticum]